MICAQPSPLRAPGVVGALLAAAVMGACGGDAREPQALPEGEITLWPIPAVGLDGGRWRPDGGGAAPADAAPDARSEPVAEPDASPVWRCGDGVVDQGEHCDDANDDDDDACNNDCHESARLLWSRDNEPNVYAQTMTVDDSGAIAVGGFAVLTAGGSDLWANKYSPEGEAAWPRAQTLDLGHDEGAEAIAFAPGGDVVVLGSSQVLGSLAEAGFLLMKYAGSDGAPRWEEPTRAMAGPEHTGTTLLVSASEEIYALATFRKEPGADVWLQAFSPMGGPLWTEALLLDEGRGEFPGAFWFAPDGALYAYWAATPGSDLELVRAAVSADHRSATTRHTALSAMNVSNYLYFAIDPEGAVVVCANIFLGDRRALWMQKYSFEGATLWAQEVREDAGATLQCTAVALDRSGNVAVAGVLSGANARIWLRLYAPDGQPRWRTPVIYDGGHETFPAGVGFDPEGNVVAAGVRLTVQNYAYLWLAKYAR